MTNRYQWSLPNNPYHPDGSAFTLFLRQLNTSRGENGVQSSGCFAGHCVWRVPSVEELRGIPTDCDQPVCGSVPGSIHGFW
ncbi:MAG: hypothetical protein P8R42_19105 [Candidatus Binatia bacterium]|nr:hypothetical protein [Candidatus Binatia bacterium]